MAFYREHNKDIPKRETIIKYSEYWCFVTWLATPTPSREPKTQKELARELSVHEITLSRWKGVDGFDSDVKKVLRVWATDRLADVMYSLYRRILKDGSASEVKLWLQWVTGWTEKQEIKHEIDQIKKEPNNEQKTAIDVLTQEFESKLKTILTKRD